MWWEHRVWRRRLGTSDGAGAREREHESVCKEPGAREWEQQ